MSGTASPSAGAAPSAVVAPLAGILVVEFTHMVMGPTVGAILAELGADIIKVEPIGGDPTRMLPGSGAGYHPMFNRGKRSMCLDLKEPRGVALAKRLLERADIAVENFRSGAMDALGLGYAACAACNPRLIYCSEKGFLSGPYQNRTALDEVAQMMGGLAYMTGPPGRPLRAGASVIDVTGGMFGVIGILAALHQRQRTARGQHVSSALFETTVYLVGQHMAQMAVTGKAPAPMPVRTPAWAIYDIFYTRDAEQIFVGVVSDSLWRKLCQAFSLSALEADPGLKTNAQRVAARASLMPQIQALFEQFDRGELCRRLEAIGMPFAPVNRPEDMFVDPHLLAGDGLPPVSLADGRTTRLPALPLEMSGVRVSRGGALARVGEHTGEILLSLGIDAEEAALLARDGIVA